MLKCKTASRSLSPRAGQKLSAFRHWHEVKAEYEPPYKPRVLQEWPPSASFAQENIEVGYL